MSESTKRVWEQLRAFTSIKSERLLDFPMISFTLKLYDDPVFDYKENPFLCEHLRMLVSSLSLRTEKSFRSRQRGDREAHLGGDSVATSGHCEAKGVSVRS